MGRGLWLAVLGLGATASCGSGTSPLPSGRLIHADPSDAVVVSDLDQGTSQRIESPLGVPGQLALSLDGFRVAFGVEPQLFERHVFAADIAAETAWEVQPQTGEFEPAFDWGVGEYFRYFSYSGGVFNQWIVEGDATVARRLGEWGPGSVVSSPTEPMLAYDECAAFSTDVNCEKRLVVERASGADRRVLATGLRIELVAFTPDGRRVIAIEDTGAGPRLMVHEVEGSTPALDLGPANWIPDGFARYPFDRRLVAPDGSAVLVIEGQSLVTVALDGSGRRTVSEAYPSGVEFLASGDILYTVEENLSNSDDAEFAYYLYADRGGSRITLVDDQRQCGSRPVASPSGRLVVWECSGGLLVASLAMRAIIARPAGWGEVLGFDEAEEGFMLATGTGATYQVFYVPIHGDAQLVLEVDYQDTPMASAQSPAFIYDP